MTWNMLLLQRPYLAFIFDLQSQLFDPYALRAERALCGETVDIFNWPQGKMARLQLVAEEAWNGDKFSA